MGTLLFCLTPSDNISDTCFSISSFDARGYGKVQPKMVEHPGRDEEWHDHSFDQEVDKLDQQKLLQIHSRSQRSIRSFLALFYKPQCVLYIETQSTIPKLLSLQNLVYYSKTQPINVAKPHINITKKQSIISKFVFYGFQTPSFVD